MHLFGICMWKGAGGFFFIIIRFYAIMHRTTVVQNKILSIIYSCFFCPENIYRPSLGKVRLGRPNPKPIQPLYFYLRRNKKTVLLRIVYPTTVWCPIYNFDFNLFKKNILQCYQKNLPKICNIYIIIIHYYFFVKSGIMPLLWSLCWCQHNLFHLVAIYNECLKRFWNFKNSTFGKCILILFLI